VKEAAYSVTEETRMYLVRFADDLVDIAAKGQAPSGELIVAMIERVLADQFYAPEPRDPETGKMLNPEDDEYDPWAQA
jgi:hypothetical protein